jgi:hypothetical protein
VHEVSCQAVQVAAERHDANDAVHPAAIAVTCLTVSGPSRPNEGSLGEPTW